MLDLNQDELKMVLWISKSKRKSKSNQHSQGKESTEVQLERVYLPSFERCAGERALSALRISDRSAFFWSWTAEEVAMEAEERRFAIAEEVIAEEQEWKWKWSMRKPLLLISRSLYFIIYLSTFFMALRYFQESRIFLDKY